MSILIINSISESSIPQLVTDVLANSFFSADSFCNFNSPYVFPSAAINPLDYNKPHTLLTMTRFTSNSLTLLQQRAPCLAGHNKENCELIAESFKNVNEVIILSHLSPQHMLEEHIGKQASFCVWDSSMSDEDFLNSGESLSNLRGQGNTFYLIEAFKQRGVNVKVIYLFSKVCVSVENYAKEVAKLANLNGSIKLPKSFDLIGYEAPLDDDLNMY